jgi:hypothetical protein
MVVRFFGGFDFGPADAKTRSPATIRGPVVPYTSLRSFSAATRKPGALPGGAAARSPPIGTPRA